MKEERAKTIAARRADYIIAIPDYAHDREWILSCGYHRCYATVVENGRAVKKALPIYAKE